MDSPYCGCKLTRVAGRGGSFAAGGRRWEARPGWSLLTALGEDLLVKVGIQLQPLWIIPTVAVGCHTVLLSTYRASSSALSLSLSLLSAYLCSLLSASYYPSSLIYLYLCLFSPSSILLDVFATLTQ